MDDPRRTLLLMVKEGKVLLALKKRGFGAGYWNGVGGKIEPGETIEQALVRECQEEIEVTPKDYNKVALLDFEGGADKDQWGLKIHAYICTDWEGEPTETEEMAPRWYKIADIPYKDMWEDDPHWLPIVLAGQSVIGNFKFDENDHLTNWDVKETKFNE